MRDDPTLRGHDIRSRPATAAEARAAAALAQRFAEQRGRSNAKAAPQEPTKNPDGNLKAQDLASARAVTAKEKAATEKILEQLAARRKREAGC